MVPPAVCWSGQPVALLDKIECSFNGLERQPGLRTKPIPETVRAVIVDPASPQGLAVKPVELAPAAADELTVRVNAISSNRGEVRRATTQGKPGDRPGWDFAGVVEERAANGNGPPVGSRVRAGAPRAQRSRGTVDRDRRGRPPVARPRFRRKSGAASRLNYPSPAGSKKRPGSPCFSLSSGRKLGSACEIERLEHR